MKIRLADWNVNRRGDLSEHLSLLDALDWDLCTLQEVRHQAGSAIAERAGVEGSHALDHAAGTSKLRGVRDGAMVLARAPFRLRGAAVVTDVPSPDRTLLARIGHDEQRNFGVSVLSAALPPATSWGALKVEQCLGIVRLLERRVAPMLVGIDANTPKTDHIIEEKVEYWWPEEAQLLGPRASHQLRDVYRELHGRTSTGMPTSFESGSIARRYDHVLASPEFTVVAVDYMFDDDVRALSDHALIKVTLEL